MNFSTIARLPLPDVVLRRFSLLQPPQKHSCLICVYLGTLNCFSFWYVISRGHSSRIPLKGSEPGCPYVPKDELMGKKPAWLKKELWLELRAIGESLSPFKKGQVTQEDLKVVIYLSREKIRRAKGLLQP